MADTHEDIIIIEDSDAALQSHDEHDEFPDENEDETKRRKIILFGGIAIIVILLIVVTTLLLIKNTSKQKINDFSTLDNKLQEAKKPVIEPSKLENMIAKANYLYSTGAKEKALTLYENIAHYSQAISQYNLGVAQMKNEQYALALKTFQNAILNDEKRCVCAINAAVCSLHVKDEASFKYYIDLAYAYLPYEINSPLYSYYYTLVNYYNKNYLAALNGLKNTNHPAYPVVQNHLSAKINALYNNNYDAIDALEKINEDVDDFSLALLYARVGDFNLAINHLNSAIIKNEQPLKAKLARSYINLKAGHIQKAASQLKKVTDEYPQEVYKAYPIRVKLKDVLFEPQKAQALYREKIQNSKFINYQKIFYFSPYKIFNANQTISYIRKGNANIYIDNVESAQEYLKKSYSSSNVDIGITKAIKKALSLKIREANQDLQKLVKIQPKHSILHYNLALTYAQMGNMLQANKHFLRSYHLDAKNYLSGVYAVMTSQLINKDYTKLESLLKDSLSMEELNEDIEQVHLNYTGGTKVMAVAISEAVKEYECDNKLYSDLSPSDFKLTLRNGDEYPTNNCIRNDVKLSVEDIYALHNLGKPKLERKHSNFYSDEFKDFIFSVKVSLFKKSFCVNNFMLKSPNLLFLILVIESSVANIDTISKIQSAPIARAS